jgi:hypothetical protein
MDVSDFTVTKDPDEHLDYIFDWTAYLALYSDTIASAPTVTGTNVTIDSHIWDGDKKVLTWVSGGLRNTTGRATCRIITTGGRTAERSIQFLIRDR